MNEFFNEAEMEKTKGMVPAPFMDRAQCYVPASQMDFLLYVCRPLVKSMSALIPELRPMRKNLQDIYVFWASIVDSHLR